MFSFAYFNPFAQSLLVLQLLLKSKVAAKAAYFCCQIRNEVPLMLQEET